MGTEQVQNYSEQVFVTDYHERDALFFDIPDM